MYGRRRKGSAHPMRCLMKIILVTIILLLTIGFLNLQAGEKSPEGILDDSKIPKGPFIVTINTQLTMNKSDIYNGALRWIENNTVFNNLETITKDANQGQIIIKGKSEYEREPDFVRPTQPFIFILNIKIQDGKYVLKFTDVLMLGIIGSMPIERSIERGMREDVTNRCNEIGDSLENYLKKSK